MSADASPPLPAPVAPDPGPTLLALARNAIAQALDLPQAVAVDESADLLQALGACFVTLNQQGQLRGCIGSLLARRTLLADVKANAVAAALQDPRFAPLAPAELAITRIEVSVLSAMQPLAFDNEAQALAQLRPGIDGVVLQYQRYSSTFLPQVWEQLPSVAEFMAHLKYKAGLPPNFWTEGLRLQRYTVRKWQEIEVT
jgi:AmmeMemoRadiSam system protein A